MSDETLPQKTDESKPVRHETTPGLATISVDELTGRLDTITEARDAAMDQGVHYGEIPGVDKQTLLKPGAEVLCTLFQFDPQPEVDVINLEGEHREYRVTGSLYHIPTGNRVGGGVGSCSTKEKKYRYRYIDEQKEVPVPSAFWDTYDKDADETMADADFSLLEEELAANGVDMPEGGEAGVTKNDDGEWRITVKAKGENPDIADTYNTCLKMAKKRWLVDAVLTATAASEMFTQDVEDLPNVGGGMKQRPDAQTKPLRRDGPKRKSDSWYKGAIEHINNKLLSGELEGEEIDPSALPSSQPITEWPDPFKGQALQVINEGGISPDDGGDSSGKGQTEDASTNASSATSNQEAATGAASGSSGERKYDSLEDAISRLMPNAKEMGEGEPVMEDKRISDGQRKRLYAIAKDNDWKDSWLGRLVKDELGYESKNEIPWGDPYDEICEALEDNELKYWISRDPDTKDMFEGSGEPSNETTGEDEEESFEQGDPDDELPF